MKLEYVLLEDNNGIKGIAPFKATEGSACYDLACPKVVPIFPHSTVVIPLLISFNISEGYYIQMYPRSSLHAKYGILSNTGIIDTDYKKTVHAVLYNSNSEKMFVQKGERIMQFTIMKKEDFTLTEVDYIQDSNRGGLGSTGI